MTIRRALPTEAELLSALALRSKAHWGYAPEFMAACRAELTYGQDDLSSTQRHFWVLEKANRVLGFYALLGNSAHMELDALFVEPQHIGQGLGQQLVAHAITTATALGAGSLVIQGDPHTEPFYLKIGAVKTGSAPSASIPGRQLPMFAVALR